jgi:release factor glutamine methyltransferase
VSLEKLKHPMSVRDALRSATARLDSAHINDARIHAEVILAFILNRERSYLWAHPEQDLTPHQSERWAEALALRATGLPTPYITGEQEFWGLKFEVSPDVLIPRPETEHLIETVLALCRDRVSLNLRIADVGTGSGCIAVSLAKELPQAAIEATDISAAALKVARANALRHGLEERIRFRQCDLLGNRQAGAFDLIAANLPYVGDEEEADVHLEVRQFEPRNAVFAGPTGLEMIARLLPQAYAALEPGGWLVVEISRTIAERARALVNSWEAVGISPDLRGIPRTLSARRPAG